MPLAHPRRLRDCCRPAFLDRRPRLPRRAHAARDAARAARPLLASLLMLSAAPTALAGTFTAFGPERFARTTAAPVTVTRTFSVRNPSTEYLLRIQSDRLASAIVSLNGVTILNPDDFNANVTLLERAVALQGTNELTVELRSQPNASIELEIIGTDNDLPAITATVTPAPNVNGWNNTPATVSFACDDATSGVALCPAAVEVSTEGAAQVISGEAVDLAGNRASARVALNIDRTPPDLRIGFPADRSTVGVSPLVVRGVVFDDLSGVAQLACNGADASRGPPDFTCEVPLTAGPNQVAVEAADVAGNVRSARLDVNFAPPPVIRITSPANLSVFSGGPITVAGTIDDPESRVTVNGIAATVAGETFTASGVPLREGSNIVTATGRNRFGGVGTASVTVLLDTTPPTVLIDSPRDGAMLSQPTVTVSGMINDIVTGTVNGDDATVSVNGRPAAISNRSFVVADLPLRRGPNTLTAVARDRAGNAGTHSVQVVLQEIAGQRIRRLAGNNQAGVIGTILQDPLLIALNDLAGNPVAGRPVTFAISRGDGLLIAEGQPARSVTVFTDAAGTASALFRLGTRTGAGNQRVTATAVGFVGEAVFCASATNTPPTQIKTVAGEMQRGVINQPLAEPFVAIVLDEGGNPVAGVPVSFVVVRGDGSFGGQPTFAAPTDTDGRVTAVLTLGPAPGINNNIVRARFDGLTGLAAAFVASGALAGPAEDTTISGVVLDNANVPIEGVTVTVRNTELRAVTNAQGQFLLLGAPVGALHLHVQGSTTTRPGEWPDLEFEINTIAGQDNTIGMPIYLLPLDAANAQRVDTGADVTLRMDGVPGFSLTVFANSARFPVGVTDRRVMVTQVHADKVPMPPVEGAAPRLVWTVQPAGVAFDPPARITYPNVDGLEPGQVVDIFSFDHDLGEFISVGTGTVSEDGAVVTSDPGVGIRKAGWGYPRRPPPPTTETERDPCEEAAQDARDIANRTGGQRRNGFDRTQACIAETSCASKGNSDDPTWLDKVMKKFIDKYKDETGDWPQVLESCNSLPNLPLGIDEKLCAYRTANYHITRDLQDSLNMEGCGTTGDWDRMGETIGQCIDQEGQDFLGLARRLVTRWRNEVRENCLRTRR